MIPSDGRVRSPVCFPYLSCLPQEVRWVGLSKSSPQRAFKRGEFSRSSLFLTLPGRAVARTGLRMMPTFPPLPLKSRTVSLPQYGFKAGISDSAFPSTTWYSRRLVCLRPSCTSLSVRRILDLSRGAQCAGAPPFKRHRRFTPGALAPAELCCLGHQRLTGPMRPTR